MNSLLRYLILTTIAVWAADYVLPGVSLSGWEAAVVVAIALGVVNWVIKPVLHVLTFPITLLTLGLFTFVINGLMVLVVDYFVSGFEVNGIVAAILFSIVTSVVSLFLNKLAK